ncbi:MAG: UDP-N-acetylglucosamine 1-carboxyvinyltransferase [Oscillospiraceae bacterium]|nr:UDP-N-acetylglucosamine 1-carboxyvinyltransferase [Oscillospiraceae bacterium]
MRWFQIDGGDALKGEVRVPGSKNSSLALLVAACMADGEVTLENVPEIADIASVCEIARLLGADVTKRSRNTLTIDPSGLSSSDVPERPASGIRMAYYFVGALLSRFGRVSVGNPGGDDIGPRPIDQHIKGFRMLGAKVTQSKDRYEVAVNGKLKGATIHYDTITSGATINHMLAAVKADGRTRLLNAARDPEVVDVAVFLNKMGARVSGAGTDRITIDGVRKLTGCPHQAIPDRLMAGTLLVAGAVTEGEVTVTGVIPEHLDSCIAKLSEVGAKVTHGGDHVTVSACGRLRPIKIETGMYPLFATDLQQPFTSLLLKASGTSVINDRIYPFRFDHCQQLRKMGAKIELRDGCAVVHGCREGLKGGWVDAGDIRSGISLILASFIADGVTYIRGVEHISRGYEDIVSTLNGLGARITLASDERPPDRYLSPFIEAKVAVPLPNRA